MISFLKRSNPFFIFLAVTFIIHLFLPLKWGDDAVFSAEAALPLNEFLYGSSRILTDTMTYIFNKYNVLWRIFNPCVLTLLAAALSKLLSVRAVWIKYFVCVAVAIPTMAIVDAGFIATTVNYLWPVTFGIVSLYIFQNIAAGKKVPVYTLIAGIPLIIYAINMEQMSAVLTASFLIGCAYLFFVKKRFHVYPLIQLAISAFGVLYAYFGNTSQDNSRMVREIGRYFPSFNELNVLQKIELGFSSTMHGLTIALRVPLAAFLAFTVFLAVISFKKKVHISARITSLVPVAFSVICAVYNAVKPIESVKNFRLTKAEYLFSPLFDILFAAVLICVLYTVAHIIKSKPLILTSYTVLAAGMASRMLMGFSPTVWASGYRTFCIMIISFIIVSVIILNRERTVSKDSLVNSK